MIVARIYLYVHVFAVKTKGVERGILTYICVNVYVRMKMKSP